MRDNKVKTLFLQVGEVSVDEMRKRQTYETLAAEMGNQRIPVLSVKNILLNQFWYMDKLFFILYGVLICLGFLFMAALRYIGVEKNEMITFCMVGSGILSIMSIGFIDRLFFGKMAEVGASCYFNTKQCIAAYLVMAGIVNLAVLTLTAVYLDFCLGTGLLQVGLYVLTPYLISSMTALGVLSREKGGRRSYALGICAVFLSIGCVVVLSVPGVFFVTSLWVWGIAFGVSGILFAMQLKKFFGQLEKGEMLCMN